MSEKSIIMCCICVENLQYFFYSYSVILLAQHVKSEMPCLLRNIVHYNVYKLYMYYCSTLLKATPSESCRLSMQNSEISESCKAPYNPVFFVLFSFFWRVYRQLLKIQTQTLGYTDWDMWQEFSIFLILLKNFTLVWILLTWMSMLMAALRPGLTSGWAVWKTTMNKKL